MIPFDPKNVFGPRVDDYVKYRPGYPAAVLDALIQECGLAPDWQVADIGSGTGLLARLFLDFGCAVNGVEPNADMRMAGEQILAGYVGFSSLAGSAEVTGLADASVDLISAGMAFHWFDAPRARLEFRRILKPGGWVALVWNRMLAGPEPFMRDYTELVLQYSSGWSETLRRDQPGSSVNLPGFFGGAFQRAAFPNDQSLDWDGLRGRTLSIAHVPQPDDPVHPAMFDGLRSIFDCYQNNGQVTIDYETELYSGRLV
jgi:SAM-dependent methyltransferase